MLQIPQIAGGIHQAISFGAYLTFELWSKPPPPRYKEGKEADASASAKASDVTFDTAYSNGVNNTRTAANAANAATNGLDQRVLRVILNSNPFISTDQTYVQSTQKKHKNSRDPRKQESWMYSWPIHEENERVVVEIGMTEYRRILTNIHTCLLAANIRTPYIHKNNSL